VNQHFVCAWVLVDDLKQHAGDDPFAKRLLSNWEYPLDLMFLSAEGEFVAKLNSFRDLPNAHPNVGHHGDPFAREGPSHTEIFSWHARHFLASPKPRSPAPVPNFGEIRGMEAAFRDTRTDSEVTFPVPAAHWKRILSLLLPAEEDEDATPAKWEHAGDLEIELAGGAYFLITLYSVNEGPGAFSSGPTREQQTYYRGGSSAKLERALAAAFKASEGSGGK